MDFATDLLRVLWHEFGHLCVGIVETEQDKNYQINEIWVSFHEKAISEEKWGGAVSTIPTIKYNVLILDADKTSFSLIDTISGCTFQTIFYGEIENQVVDIEGCFGLGKSCAGRGDARSFHEIGFQYRQKFGNRESFTKYLNVELFDLYMQQITDNKPFLEALRIITIKYRDIILKSYHNSENQDDFYYHFEDENLISLKHEVLEILIATELYQSILNLKESIIEKMEVDKVDKS